MRSLVLVLTAFLLQSLIAEEAPQDNKLGDEQEVVSNVCDDAVPSLVNLSFLPSAVVNGCVNVISGDLCENETDDIVSGVDPYILGHNYCSSSLDEANLGDGWSFMHHQVLEVYMPCRMRLLSPRSYPSAAVPWLFSLEEFEAKYSPTPSSLYGETDLDEASDYVSACSDSSDSSDSSDASDSSPGFFFEGPLQARGLEEKRRDDHRPRSSGPSYPDHLPVFLSLYEPSGARMLFKARADQKEGNTYKLRSFNLVTKNSGYTNVSGGSISAHTNVKNTVVTYDSKDDAFTVVLGDGTRRIYERAKGYKPVHKKPHQAKYYRRYLLHKEIKPSGNRVTYEYNSSSEIIRISTYNSDYSHKINEVLFDQKSTGSFAKHPSLHVRTSDGFEHIYRCTKLKGHFPHGTYGISCVQSPGRPDTTFTYCEKSAQHKRRVIRKARSDGFYIETKYYRPGTNQVGKNKVAVKGHFRKNRVRSQRGPFGPNGQQITTHRYFYYKDKHGGGHTSVYDAMNNFTRYYYNKDKRVICVRRFNGYKEKLMSERFHWGSASQEGFLKGHVVYDEEDKPKLARYFSYDSRGNVVKETLYGRITENDGSVRIRKGEPWHESCDKQVKRFTYSKDGFNLKTSECDPLGNYTFYTYVKETNLLEAKYVCEKKEVRKREFFAYDKNANLIKHIVDDGRSKDKDSLKQVTERHITKITPRTERPHFGEPEVVQEYYYDLGAEKKVLLKKTVNHFSKQGLVIKKELFDQEGARVCHEYAYDFAGRLVWSKDPHGHETFSSYDKWGRLVEKRGPRQDVWYRYEYDVAGRLIKEVEEQTNGLRLATCYTYDVLGRKIAVTTPQENTTRYEYDALNRMTKIVYPPIYDYENKKIVPEKKFEHKKLGIRVVETDENGNNTCTMYNALGKITHQHFADNTEQFYEYDLKGNLVKEVASNGAVSSYTLDGFDRVTQSHMQKDTTVLSHQEVVYSAFHPVKEIGPTGETVEYSYDFAGRKVQEMRSGPFENKRSKTFAYDARGRFVETRTLMDQNEFIAQSYTYDDLDQLQSERVYSHKEPLCSYKSYSYDAEGNRISTIQNIDGQEAISQVHYLPHSLAEWSLDAMGNKTLYKYFYQFKNDHGQKVFRKDITDARDCTVEERFDVRGNISEVLRFDPSGTVIAHRKQFYDAVNNLVRLHESAIVDGREQRVIVTVFEYGKNNRLEKVIEAVGTAEEKVTSYAYNRYGQKEATTFSDGTILYYAYDAKGRLEHFFAHDKSFDYTYSYDNADRILAVTNGVTGAKTTRCYNGFGELVSEVLESGLTLTYAYDAVGRISEMIVPDGSKVCYNYSPAYLQQVHRVDRQGNKRCVHTIQARDLAGNIQTTDKTLFSRDKLGRCTRIEHEAFKQQVPSDGFDPVGNQLKLYIKDPQGEMTREFAYDFLSQLVEEKGVSTNTYRHDSLNNRLTHNEDQYSNNALHAVLTDGKRTFTYDGRGNRIAMQSGDTTVCYTYDAMDRLIGVEGPDVHVSYSYDAFNRRIEKRTGMTAVQYLYSFDNEIGAVVDGAVCELRLLGEGFGAEIGAAVYMEVGGASYTPIHDRQGSVAVLLDETDQVAESYRHDAFGKEVDFSHERKNPWRFSSKRVDKETGFVYFGRRYYDPSIGKWLTQDPLGVKAGPNLYAYVLNNPMTKFDLYGLYVETEADRPISKWRPYKYKDPKIVGANHHAIMQMYERGGYRTTSGSCFGKNDKGYAAVPLQDRPELSGGTIVYVPGMLTSFPRAVEQAMYLSDLCGGYQVNIIQNFSHGILDIPRAIAETFGLKTDACQDLRDFLQDIMAAKGEGHKFLILGFSEGAIITRNALTGDDQKRIYNATHALGVCPGTAIDSRAATKSKNIANGNPIRDFVPYLERFGSSLLGVTGSLLFSSFKRAEVESVPSHPDAPFFDHDVTSPTYAKRIGEHFNAFREEIGGQ